jgi:hypothetical protein
VGEGKNIYTTLTSDVVIDETAEFIASFGGAVVGWPVSVAGQQTGKLYSIGFLTAGTSGEGTPYLPAFVEGLRQLGLIEGKNVVIEYRFAENHVEQLPELVTELVRLKVDVIVAVGTLAPLAARQVTTTIPIVMTSGGDPLGSGLVASAGELLRVCRSGGRIGLANWTPDGFAGQLFSKYLQPPPGVKSPALWGTPARLTESWSSTTRMRLLMAPPMELGASRQLHSERRALAYRRFDPNATAMHFHDLLGNGQPEAGATLGLCVGAINLVELLEYARPLLLGDAWPCVSHADRKVTVDGFRGDAHLASVGKLDRVPYEIEEHLSEALLVA